LGIAALEDKIVQQAVVTILNQIQLAISSPSVAGYSQIVPDKRRNRKVKLT
jgi:hypothetical protein